MKEQEKNFLRRQMLKMGFGFGGLAVWAVGFGTNRGSCSYAASRTEIYENHFPTGSWLEVKGLALPEFMIEIELEAHKSE